MVLTGKVAFVAGASRGIGAAIAYALADAGASVVVAARSTVPGKLPGTVHTVAEAIRARGGAALPVECDVTSEESVVAAVAAAVQAYGRLDILIANAGVLWLGPIGETPLRRWEMALRVNLTGTFLVTRTVLPHVTEQGGSLVAITTSGVADTHLGSNAYWVAKAGVERLYTGLASELAAQNVAVNCLAPSGVVLTEGWAAGGNGVQVPAEMVEPAESVAAAAVHLAGQDAHGITGGVWRSRDLLAAVG